MQLYQLSCTFVNSQKSIQCPIFRHIPKYNTIRLTFCRRIALPRLYKALFNLFEMPYISCIILNRTVGCKNSRTGNVVERHTVPLFPVGVGL